MKVVLGIFLSHFVTDCEAHDGDGDSKGDVLGSGGTLKPLGWRPMERLEHHFCPDIAPKPTGMLDTLLSFLSCFGGAFSSGLLPGLSSWLAFLLSPLGVLISSGKTSPV